MTFLPEEGTSHRRPVPSNIQEGSAKKKRTPLGELSIGQLAIAASAGRSASKRPRQNIYCTKSLLRAVIEI